METSMRIIGVSGFAGAGKDTLAYALEEGFQFCKMALADPIKEACASWFDWDRQTLWGASHLRNKPDPRYGDLTPRRALQFVGTEIGRNLYPNVWVDCVMRRAEKALREHGYNLLEDEEDGPPRYYERGAVGVVISDVRFRNEIDAIQKAGGWVVRIKREGAGLAGSGALHPSEAEQAKISDDDFDFVVENDGTVEDLGLVAEAIAREFWALHYPGLDFPFVGAGK